MERFRLLLCACAVTSFGTAAVIACTPAPLQTSPIKTHPDTDDDDDNKKRTDDDDDAVPVNKGESDPPLPDGGKPPGRVYAHTATSLYLFDPLIKTLTKIGDFNLAPFADDERMLDIALDADSVMYGTTDHGFVRIDPLSAKVTYVKKVDESFTFPNALSFVPVGTVDPTKEALVGYQQKAGAYGPTTYVRIDLVTGNITEIGDLNPPNAAINWRSAGDIISTIRNGNKAYLTVQLFEPDGGGPVEGDPGTDSLAEINPTTGQIIKIIGDIGQANFYGLGQWAGTAYGFNSAGNIVEINMDTGAGKTILTLSEDGGTGSWFGAGMTTNAPTKP